jgi:phage baseplate assembly protein W
MAYNLVKIPVADLRPSTAIGVAIPFQAPNAFTSVYTTLEQTKYNILNFLLTDQGERPFNPNFGASIRNKVFEQITADTLDSLDTQIRTGVNQYFPNVVITDLTFGGSPDENLLTIQFSYTISNTGASDNITLSLNG